MPMLWPRGRWCSRVYTDARAAAELARRRTPATSGPCGRRYGYGAGERGSVSVSTREQQLRPETAETMVEDEVMAQWCGSCVM